MFSRALALLDKIQERLALDRGSALSRALAEKEATSATAKQDASTAFPLTQDGSQKIPPANQPLNNQPAKQVSKRKRKPAQLAGKKSKSGKASAQTPTVVRSGKRGE